jgi:putative MATE family efflux protein
VRSPLGIAVAANVVNVVLELVFVYRFHWGVAGSAWGTVVAQVLAAAWFLVLLGRRIAASDGRLDPIRAEMARLLAAGRHLFVRTAALLATLALATSVASRLGGAVLGGHQIALQVHSFIALALDALAIPGQILVATRLGAGDATEARAVSDRLLRLGAMAGGLVAAGLLAAAPFLPRVFSTDGPVRHAATVALVVAAAVQVPAALAFVLDGILIGAGDVRYLALAMAAATFCFVPCAAAVLASHAGLIALWSALFVFMLARLVGMGRRFLGNSWLVTGAVAT